MKQRIIDAARKRLVRRLRARHQQVKPTACQPGLFNYRCHDNCVDFLRRHPGKGLTIWETVYVEDGNEPALHYLIRDEKAGTWLEATLGWRCDDLEFYLVRPLLEADHGRIHSEFNRSLADWTAEFVRPAWRWLFNIDRIL